MSGDNIASLLYLSLLGAVIAGYFLMSHRHEMGKMAQQAVIWGLIIVGLVAAYGLWDEMQVKLPASGAVIEESGEIILPRASDGHFYMTLDVNDAPIRFLVDTGATHMVLSTQDAQKAGIDTQTLPFFGKAQTANGTVSTAMVRLDRVAYGPMLDQGVRAKVSAGEMPGSLLGMSYLNRFENISISGNKMKLTP